MKHNLALTLVAWASTVISRADRPPGPDVLADRPGNGVVIRRDGPLPRSADGRLVEGSPEFGPRHDGVTDRSAIVETRRRFDAVPGGHASSPDGLASLSPESSRAIRGRLVSAHDPGACVRRNVEVQGNPSSTARCRTGSVAEHTSGGKRLVFVDRRGVALQGYDPVSYVIDGKPAKGDPTIVATFDGGHYRFTSQEHRAAFLSDPRKYVPAYGGFCGYAASIGKVRPANPLLWSVVDGQLVVQHTQGAAALWEKDPKANKARADRFWPRLVELKAGKRNPIDRLLGKSVLANLP